MLNCVKNNMKIKIAKEKFSFRCNTIECTQRGKEVLLYKYNGFS